MDNRENKSGYKKEKAREPADSWAEKSIEEVKAAGIMVGDPDGNFRPQSDIRREEVAVIISNIIDKVTE